MAKALRKAATKLTRTRRLRRRLVIDEANLREYLGRPRFTPESQERTAVPGVATGLAVTGMGGDVLFIEAGAVDGKPGRDPHRPAGRRDEGVGPDRPVLRPGPRRAAGDTDPSVLDRQLHLHVPAGAVPKDGPSAGVTMVTALTSMATGRPVRSEVGMTGEVTLNGRVLPIGGVKQKLLAAQRAGLTTVFMPERNEPDLDDVPGDVLAAIEIRPMADVADLVSLALEDAKQETLAA